MSFKTNSRCQHVRYQFLNSLRIMWFQVLQNLLPQAEHQVEDKHVDQHIWKTMWLKHKTKFKYILLNSEGGRCNVMCSGVWDRLAPWMNSGTPSEVVMVVVHLISEFYSISHLIWSNLLQISNLHFYIRIVRVSISRTIAQKLPEFITIIVSKMGWEPGNEYQSVT